MPFASFTEAKGISKSRRKVEEKAEEAEEAEESNPVDLPL